MFLSVDEKKKKKLSSKKNQELSDLATLYSTYLERTSDQRVSGTRAWTVRWFERTSRTKGFGDVIASRELVKVSDHVLSMRDILVQGISSISSANL